MVARLLRFRYLAACTLFSLAVITLLVIVRSPHGAQAESPTRPYHNAPIVEGVEPLPPGVSVQTVLTGMVKPVALAFDPTGRLFYTEKETGHVRLFANGALQPDPVITFAVDGCAERGLLGIAVDPNFNANHYVYAFYTARPPQGCGGVLSENRVVRFVESGGVGLDPVTIFSSPQRYEIHNGGNIHFGPDGKLYITLGDDYFPTNAQDVTCTNGKIHRINPDGTIPNDNPVFTGTGALPSIYAIGLRNSFDFTFDPFTPGRLFASENGSTCDDEMNRIEAGYNYGWRDRDLCEGANPDPTYNTIRPLWHLPSELCCEAPTGIEFYTGYSIPQWTNQLFMTSFGSAQASRVRHFYLNADRTQVTAVNVVQGITANTDLQTGADGAFWYIEGGGYYSGQLKRISGSGPTPTALPTATSTSTSIPTITPTAIPTVPVTGCGFTDMPESNTFYPYVQCLACGGIVGGYPCGGEREACDPNSDPYFRPNNPITRAQLAKIVSNSANYNGSPSAQTYEDVSPDHPFYAWVERLTERGVMGGYPCGSLGAEPCVSPQNRPYFRPSSEATRGQIAKIVSNSVGFNGQPTGQTFEDIAPGSAFYEWVERLAGWDVMGGYPCGTLPDEPCVAPANRPYFRPQNRATRGQVTKIVVNAFFPRCGGTARR